MPSKTSLPMIMVVLGLSTRTVAEVITRSTEIANAIAAASKMFPTPPVPIATVLSDISALSAAETNAIARTKGLITIRDAKLAVVIADCKQLHGYVQTQANANPTQAAEIAAAAAMTLRKAGARHKSDLAVKQTVSTTVKVTAKSVKGARSHEWQYSTDGGKTWIAAPPTSQSSTTIPNLTPGVLHMFRQRVITKAGPSDWSQPFSFLVS